MKRLITTFAHLMAAELMTRGLLLLSQLLVVRILAPDAFGAYIYALSVALLVGLVVEFGLTAMVTRDVSADNTRASKLLSEFLWAQLVLGIGAVALAGIVLAVGDLNGPATTAQLAIALAAVGANALSRPFEATLVGTNQTRWVTVSRTVRGAVLLGGTAIAWAVEPEPAAFLWAVVASEIAGTLAAWILTGRTGVRPERAVGRAGATRLLRAALPFALVTAINLLYLRVDVLMLGLMSDDVDVGNYGAASRILETAVVIPAFFGSAFLATIAGLGPRTPEARAQTEQALRLIVLVCTPIAVALAVSAEPVLELLITGSYETADDVLVRLTPMLLLIASYGVLLSVQVALDRIMLLAAINVAGLVLKVGLNLWAIPEYGVKGAAIAAVAAEAVVVILQWIAARDLVHTRRVLAAYARTLAAGAAMLGAVLLLDDLPWVPAVLIGVLVYVAAAFAVRAVTKQDVSGFTGSLRA